jgi:hypothetical protein
VETKSDLRKFIARLKPDVKARIQKTADNLGYTFDEVAVSLYSRYECNIHNLFMGEVLEVHSTCQFRHKDLDRILKKRKVKRDLKIKEYVRTIQEGRGGDSSIDNGGEDTGAI